MEDRIEKLYEAVGAARKEYLHRSKTYGATSDWATAAHYELKGLEKAFEIVAGVSETEYTIQRLGIRRESEEV